MITAVSAPNPPRSNAGDLLISIEITKDNNITNVIAINQLSGPAISPLKPDDISQELIVAVNSYSLVSDY